MKIFAAFTVAISGAVSDQDFQGGSQVGWPRIFSGCKSAGIIAIFLKFDTILTRSRERDFKFQNFAHF